MTPQDDLVRHYRWLRQYGYNDSHSGNASIRVGDRFWITPTGACADTLKVEDLLACPLEGACPPGASLDAPLHQRVYQFSPTAQAVLHSHGPYTVGVTLSRPEFQPLDFEGWLYFKAVPVLRIPYEAYVRQAPAAVAAALRDHPVAVVLGHGVYAAAPSLNLAYKWTCSLELSAKTFAIAQALGGAADLR